MSLFHLYTRVLQLLGKEARLGWILAVANLLLATAQFAEPILFGRIVDVMSGNLATGALVPETRSPWPLLGAWVGFGLFTIMCSALVALQADRLAHRRRQAVLTSYFEHILQLPISFHTGTHSGRLMKVMLQGTDALWRMWLGFFREHFAAILSLVVLLPLSLYINWRLAILLFVLCIVFTVLTTLVVHKTYGMQGEVEAQYSDLSARASDALGNVALVQSFVRVDAEVQGLRNVSGRLLEAQMPVLSWWALVTVITRASTTITVLSIFALGIYLNQQGLTSVGEIVMFVSFATLLIQRLEQVVNFINNVLMEAPRLREFIAVLDTVPAVRDRADAIDCGRLSGLVEFQNVSFSYDGKRPAIEDLSFTALPGDTIALVGATGAGKSTAIALLHRAFDPQSGVIKVDGMDIRGITLASLRRNIGVVFQEALLFDRSIADNLRVGKPDATPEELRLAAERAQALEFIERSDHKFDTNAGERGRMLSGGERQRLSIARALLKDPPILILDEATSALDAVTEAKLNLALDEVMKGRTTFVIAHRLSTIRDATRILVFDNGKVIESGTFDELVARGGAFAQLARAQFMVQESARSAMSSAADAQL
ncbi:glucan ABC transporter ATP-binding protein/ permease [Rhodopseudomonas palustris]|uniref:Beta-(1-->2)glucan export ATP-binding/permease protein NdvA n=2 Tax=Rhodopseudomonas palustris (strain ATCC BAA-98 / CGA009) TaxID=258594 RepID=NDVA_RHOPA|nr:glucan ABC transporter ATP-binding protein/ permease [Rhodopseudomonas palustris]Q6N1Y7.1 RecName: Full=Beta-(1-->2)glucan export ATP-binding/permease protein NdvA [Rhodopseudomonas palustris CGA009]OPF92349.1 beta-(1-->2)glucan export ATP-binding/permease NdvA [Rhodopseudomonas palustris]PPQ41819.1 beta-(1-->2)glucan export ATP-binding/permease NdvA [Rhodopseudomonas palustris]QQM05828.1 Beta-(1-->2)glucan export ATP-binding/permease protein NdvA [Rhodopseudomonas palustris]RJF64039.1 beta